MTLACDAHAAVGAKPQLGLVCHCLELLGAPLGHWQSSNATAAQNAKNQMDHLTGASAELLLQPGWHTTGEPNAGTFVHASFFVLRVLIPITRWTTWQEHLHSCWYSLAGIQQVSLMRVHLCCQGCSSCTIGKPKAGMFRQSRFFVLHVLVPETRWTTWQEHLQSCCYSLAGIQQVSQP